MAKRKAGSQIGSLIPDHQKSGIDPISLHAAMCNIPLERFRQRLQLCFRPRRNRRSAQEVMRLQSHGTPNCWNFETPTWESWDKKPFGCGPRGEARNIYYKEEGGGFPQVQAVVSLVCPSYMWLVLTPKVLQLCINHFMLVLCRLVWMSEACHFFLVPSWSFSTPLYPSIMLWAREQPGLFTILLFSVWDSHLSPSRS
jgi:hypothetical protein